MDGAQTMDTPCQEVVHVVGTSIGGVLYRDCLLLRTLTMSNDITYIAEYAFNGCQSLASVTFSNGLVEIDSYAFYGCSSLTSVELPDSLLRLQFSAFEGCKNLEKVTFGTGLTYIEHAFSGCCNLEFAIRGSNPNFVLSDDNLMIYSKDYSRLALTSPKLSTLANLDSRVVTLRRMSCRSVNWSGQVVIPDHVEVMEQDVFSNSPYLTSIKFGKNLRTISSLEFRSCPNIVSYEVDPENQYFAEHEGVLYNKAMETMLSYPAANSSTLLNLPATIRNFGTTVFVNCPVTQFTLTNGKYLTLSSDGVTLYDKSDPTKLVRVAPGYNGSYTVDENIRILGAGSMSGTRIATMNISNVQTLMDWCFYGTKFITLDMSKVTYIGSNAFHGSSVAEIRVPGQQGTFQSSTAAYSTVKKIIIEEGIRIIDAYAAQYCTKLVDVYIPESVEEIRQDAFRATGIAELHLPTAKLHTIETGAFMGTNMVHIVIPECVKLVEDDAFASCGHAESVVIASCNTCCYRNAFRSTEDRVHVYCVATIYFTVDTNICKVTRFAPRAFLFVYVFLL